METMSTKASKKTSTLLVNENLRRKHIQTLEICQQLVDENAALKMGHTPDVFSTPDISKITADPNVTELAMLKLKEGEHVRNEASLKATILELEKKCCSYKDQLDKATAENELKSAALNESVHKLEENNSIMKTMRSDMEKQQRDLDMKNVIIEQFRNAKKKKDNNILPITHNEHTTTATAIQQPSSSSSKADLHTDESETKRHSLIIEQLKTDIKNLQENVDSGERVVERLNNDIVNINVEHEKLLLKKESESFLNEQERLRLQAENKALQTEVQRLSKLHAKPVTPTPHMKMGPPPKQMIPTTIMTNTASTQTESPEKNGSDMSSLQITTRQKEEELGREELTQEEHGREPLTDLRAARKKKNAGGAVVKLSDTVEKESKQFAEFISLKRENQLLKMQIGDLKKTHKKSMGLTRSKSIAIGNGI
jgi:hypothetical protein